MADLYNNLITVVSSVAYYLNVISHARTNLLSGLGNITDNVREIDLKLYSSSCPSLA